MKAVTHKFPKITMNKPERLWLTSVYSSLKDDKEVNNRELRIALWNKLPNNFDPYKIDRRLVLNGNQITLLGIWHIHPDTDLLDKTDQIILCIRELILKDPTLTEFHAEKVSQITGITMPEVAMIFQRFLHQLGRFQETATPYVEQGKHLGYWSIGIQTEDALNQYLNYKDMPTLMKEFSMRMQRTLPRTVNLQDNQTRPQTAFIIM